MKSDPVPNRGATRRRIRRRRSLAALVAALSAGVSGTAPASAGTTVPVACSWTPAATIMSFGPWLAGTVRVVGGEIQILHVVHCTDGREEWRWVPASYDGVR